MPSYKLKTINKHFALEETVYSRRSIIPNPFELSKQMVLLRVIIGKKIPLPYTAYSCYKYEEDYPDLIKWFEGLTQPNSPSKIDFRRNPKRFRELVEPLDFSKPYDQSVVDAIHKEFEGVSKTQEIDASDMIAAELEE